MKMASKGSATDWSSWMLRARTGIEVLAARARETEPDLPHRLHVVGPLVDQR